MTCVFAADGALDSGMGSTVYSDSHSSQQSVLYQSLLEPIAVAAQQVCTHLDTDVRARLVPHSQTMFMCRVNEQRFFTFLLLATELFMSISHEWFVLSNVFCSWVAPQSVPEHWPFCETSASLV